MPEDTKSVCVARFRDWETLASWLRADWRGACEMEAGDREPLSYSAGYKEMASTIGRIMREAAPADREAVLYQFLTETLSSGPEADS